MGSLGPYPGFEREKPRVDPATTRYFRGMDWNAVDAERLFAAIRQRRPRSDAERSIWAFERALVAARIDGSLLRHLLVACVCLVAHEEDETPRTVLERVFRRAVSDQEWREQYAPLIE